MSTTKALPFYSLLRSLFILRKHSTDCFVATTAGLPFVYDQEITPYQFSAASLLSLRFAGVLQPRGGLVVGWNFKCALGQWRLLSQVCEWIVVFRRKCARLCSRAYVFAPEVLQVQQPLGVDLSPFFSINTGIKCINVITNWTSVSEAICWSLSKLKHKMHWLLIVVFLFSFSVTSCSCGRRLSNRRHSRSRWWYISTCSWGNVYYNWSRRDSCHIK